MFPSGKYYCFPRVSISHGSPIGSQGHLNSIRHFYESSSLDAGFAVEPGSADDLAEIVRSSRRRYRHTYGVF